jgi:hypothetical protein
MFVSLEDSPVQANWLGLAHLKILIHSRSGYVTLLLFILSLLLLVIGLSHKVLILKLCKIAKIGITFKAFCVGLREREKEGGGYIYLFMDKT